MPSLNAGVSLKNVQGSEAESTLNKFSLSLYLYIEHVSVTKLVTLVKS